MSPVMWNAEDEFEEVVLLGHGDRFPMPFTQCLEEVAAYRSLILAWHERALPTLLRCGLKPGVSCFEQTADVAVIKLCSLSVRRRPLRKLTIVGGVSVIRQNICKP